MAGHNFARRSTTTCVWQTISSMSAMRSPAVATHLLPPPSNPSNSMRMVVALTLESPLAPLTHPNATRIKATRLDQAQAAASAPALILVRSPKTSSHCYKTMTPPSHPNQPAQPLNASLANSAKSNLIATCEMAHDLTPPPSLVQQTKTSSCMMTTNHHQLPPTVLELFA